MSSKLRSLLSGTVLVGGVLVGGWALMVSLSPSKEQMMEVKVLNIRVNP